MNRQVLTIIALILVCAYGSCRVLYGQIPSFNYDWLSFILLWLSPWFLFFASLKSWHRCYTWRVMSDHKNIEPVLPRGQYAPSRKTSRPHITEYSCCAFFILSLAAILKLFSVPHIGWIISSGIFSLFILHLALKNISRLSL